MFLHAPSPSHPKKIISLVPSITELLFDLNLSNRVVGITKFCVHPAQWFQTKEKIGGTKNVNFEKIRLIKPDLIIASKEENIQEQVEVLAKEFPVYLTDVTSYETGLKMINDIGAITSRVREATALITTIQLEFDSLLKLTQPINAIYLIWKEPYMTVGGDTFIHNLLHKVGLQNIFSNQSRYPQITLEELPNLNPHLILLSSEPYPFKEKHVEEIQQFLPTAKVLLVDGEMFSWYGSRMQFMPAYFNKLLAGITV